MANPAWQMLRSMAALVLAPAAVAHAQSVAISAHLGQYSPSQPIYEVARAGVAGPVGKYKLEGASLRGAAVTVWLSDRFGLSLGGGTADTRLTFRGIDESVSVDMDPAEIRFGQLSGVAITSRPTSVLQPYVTAGVAYIQRGGEVFASRDDNGLVGFTIGAGLRIRVARALLTGGLEIMDYSGKYQVHSGPNRAFLQRDFQLKGGVEVPLMGR